MRTEKIWAILRCGGPVRDILEGPMTLDEAISQAKDDETAIYLKLIPVDTDGNSIENPLRIFDIWPTEE